MSICSGCYNGCAQIISDQCVKYTGDDIEFLGIETNMPLAEVEEKIVAFLETVLDGSGIIPTLPDVICELVDQYLPESGDITLNDVIEALITAACDLQDAVDLVEADIATLNATYTIPSCLSVSGDAGTHDVLQAVITKLCSLNTTVNSIYTSLNLYVKISDLDGLISDYLDDHLSEHLQDLTLIKMYTRMVPYVAVEYYGDLSNYPNPGDGFDITGVGQGAWEDVYLCNGLHGTPDKKGVIPIGMTDMGGTFAYIPANPAFGAPTYATLKGHDGANFVTLGVTHLPAHKHVLDAPVVTDPGHRHLFGGDEELLDINNPYEAQSSIVPKTNWENNTAYTSKHFYTKGTDLSNLQSHQTTGISVSVSMQNTGSNTKFSIVPPVMACRYIMYIPS